VLALDMNDGIAPPFSRVVASNPIPQSADAQPGVVVVAKRCSFKILPEPVAPGWTCMGNPPVVVFHSMPEQSHKPATLFVSRPAERSVEKFLNFMDIVIE